MPRLIALLAVALLLGQGEPVSEDGLERPTDAVWRARDGHILIADQDGARLIELDSGWNPVASGAAPPAGAEQLHALADRWWALDGDGRWWVAASVSAGFAPADAVPLALSRLPQPQILPGGRQLIVEQAAGRVSVTAADWERAPQIQWGPGWAAIEWRGVAPVGAAIEWESADGVLHSVPLEADRFRALVLRAHLEPLESGQTIKLRLPARPGGYPRRPWGEWQTLTVPQVDPAGDRPQQRLDR